MEKQSFHPENTAQQIENPQALVSLSQRQSLRKSITETPYLSYLISVIGQENLAYVFIAIGATTWVMGFIYSSQNNFHVVQTALVRGISLTLLNGVIIKVWGYNFEFGSIKNFKLLEIRNSAVILHGLMFSFVQFYLPQPILNTINNSGPIFVFILDYLLNGIRINKNQVIGVIIGCIGLLFVVNGQIIMNFISPGHTNSSQFKNYLSKNIFVCLMVSLLQILITFYWAFGVIQTKFIENLTTFHINFHLGMNIMIICGIIYPLFITNPVSLNKFIFNVCTFGFMIAFGQLFYIAGLCMSKNTGKVTIVGFISVIQGYLLSIFRYNQAINLICLIGAIVMVFGIKKVLFQGNKQ